MTRTLRSDWRVLFTASLPTVANTTNTIYVCIVYVYMYVPGTTTARYYVSLRKKKKTMTTT